MYKEEKEVRKQRNVETRWEKYGMKDGTNTR
jgi:hypothetical protein